MWSKYNIDALSNGDGTYKPATFKWIMGSRDCGHTAHLETELGVVAFRPYKDPDGKKRWRLDFYGPYQDNIANRDSENADFSNNYEDKLDLIRWAYKRLNGSLDTPYKPVGDYKSVSYKTVPKRWLRAIKAAGTTEWVGMGQRSFERIPFPEEVDVQS